MLLGSLFPDEARDILVTRKLLRVNANIEDQIGQKLIIRFNLLGGNHVEGGGYRIANENISFGPEGIKTVKDDLVCESIVRSCVIQNVEVTSFVYDSRVPKLAPEKDVLDCFQFKFFVDFKNFVLGKIQFLCLIDNDLCLAYWDDDEVEGEESMSQDEILVEKFKYLKLADYMLV